MVSFDAPIKDILLNQTFWIKPCLISHCTYPSDLCDYTQHSLNKNHHHALVDRGVFNQCRKGTLYGGDWDKLGPLFTDLAEYNALLNHFNGTEDWRSSVYANRIIDYLKSNIKGVRNINKTGYEWLTERLIQIENLYHSLQQFGYKSDSIDDPNDLISINLSRNNIPLFNNRGHHRLSLSKILGLDLVPVQVIVKHSSFIK